MAYELKYWKRGKPVIPTGNVGDLTYWKIGKPFVVYEDSGGATTQSQTVTAKSRIKSTGEIQTVSAKANIYRAEIAKTTLVSPSDGSTGLTNPVTLVWEIPESEGDNIHAHIQVDDTDNTFGSLEHEQESWDDNSSMEYWDGSDWITYPTSGVDPMYSGNQARITVSLTTGLKYWRVRGEAG